MQFEMFKYILILYYIHIVYTNFSNIQSYDSEINNLFNITINIVNVGYTFNIIIYFVGNLFIFRFIYHI